MEVIHSNISFKEATHSNTATRLGIDNIPKDVQIKAMKLVAEKVFGPLRKKFSVPIGISSFFRSIKLNSAIGGSKTSQHCKGEAIDLDADIYGRLTNAQIFNYIKDNLDFDQLIWEYGNDNEPDWVHVSYKPKGNRKNILKAVKGKGYIPYKKTTKKEK